MWTRHRAVFAPENGAGSGGGDGGGQGNNGGGGGTTGGGQQPWHTGIDAELIGHAQNKAWPLDDPKAAFENAAKAARAAEQHLGVPPDRLIKLPKDVNDKVAWDQVWGRLGRPADAKDYDFAAVKDADGKDIPAALADTIRAAAFAANLSKDAAPQLATAIVKHLDGITTAQRAEAAAKLTEEKATLAKEWGANFDINKLNAIQGAKRLGVEPETVALLESHVGYAKVMEMFRKVGAGTKEDTFVEGQGGTKPMTLEAAKARKADLIADEAFRKRWTSGERDAVKEMTDLDLLIANAA